MMIFYQHELIVKMKQAEIERKAKDAWKWYKHQTPSVKPKTSTETAYTCCQA